MTPLLPGLVLRHYKGGHYVVIAWSTNSETEEKTIVYMSLETNEVWNRPVAMFSEYVNHGDGSEVPRFTALNEHKDIFIGSGTISIVKGLRG